MADRLKSAPNQEILGTEENISTAETNRGSPVDKTRVSAWNRWLQDRQKKLKELKSGDPLFRENELTKRDNNVAEKQSHITEKTSSKVPIVKEILNGISNTKFPKNVRPENKPHAELLREASLRAKDKKNVYYDCFSNQSNAKLSEWLNTYKPSTIREKVEDIGSIVIYGFTKNEAELCDYKNKFEMDSTQILQRDAVLLDEWKTMTEESNTNITYNTICELAKKYKILGGKWLFSVNHKVIDSLWSEICFQINKASAAASRGYKMNSGDGEKHEGIPCIAAKVSPGRKDIDHLKSGNNSRYIGTFMIFIYTSDFTDDKTIFSIEKSLRRCGIHLSMTYKPDIFSVLGIYRQNRFSLRPTIYQSHCPPADCTANDTMPNDTHEGIDSRNTMPAQEEKINSVIDSCINEFQMRFQNWKCTEHLDIKEQVAQEPIAMNINSPGSEPTCTTMKGKLGRNIVLQVLKRKQREAKEKKISEENQECPANSNNVNGATPICIEKVPQSVTDDMIKGDCEAKFGPVAKIERYSVCSVTFKEEQSVEKLMESSLQIGGKAKLGGYMLEVKEQNP